MSVNYRYHMIASYVPPLPFMMHYPVCTPFLFDFGFQNIVKKPVGLII